MAVNYKQHIWTAKCRSFSRQSPHCRWTSWKDFKIAEESLRLLIVRTAEQWERPFSLHSSKTSTLVARDDGTRHHIIRGIPLRLFYGTVNSRAVATRLRIPPKSVEPANDWRHQTHLLRIRYGKFRAFVSQVLLLIADGPSAPVNAISSLK